VDEFDCTDVDATGSVDRISSRSGLPFDLAGQTNLCWLPPTKFLAPASLGLGRAPRRTFHLFDSVALIAAVSIQQTAR